ncbi:MAG: hypothetical protein P8X90_11155 [Desulfobacterales bacterium]
MQAAKFKEKSYWMTTRDYLPGEPLQKDIAVDVAVVGGGFTGLSSAYHIKKAEPKSARDGRPRRLAEPGKRYG